MNGMTEAKGKRRDGHANFIRLILNGFCSLEAEREFKLSL